jgi:hypothetical protein
MNRRLPSRAPPPKRAPTPLAPTPYPTFQTGGITRRFYLGLTFGLSACAQWAKRVTSPTAIGLRTHLGAERLVTVHDISGGLPGTLLEEYRYDGNGNRQRAVSTYPGAVALNAELGINLGCPDATGTPANDQDERRLELRQSAWRFRAMREVCARVRYRAPVLRRPGLEPARGTQNGLYNSI